LNIDDVSVQVAFAGDQVSATLSGIDMQNVSVGYILCDPAQPIPVTSHFEARIVVFNIKLPITKGYSVSSEGEYVSYPKPSLHLLEFELLNNSFVVSLYFIMHVYNRRSYVMHLLSTPEKNTSSVQMLVLLMSRSRNV
jgi:GTPase